MPCRGGKSGVRVRVFGDASLAWAEAAEAWGCSLEAVIGVSSRGYNKLVRLLTSATPITVIQAFSLFTPKRWNGILAATLHKPIEAELFERLFQKWRPAPVIMAFSGDFTRRQVLQVLPDHKGFYHQ